MSRHIPQVNVQDWMRVAAVSRSVQLPADRRVYGKHNEFFSRLGFLGEEAMLYYLDQIGVQSTKLDTFNCDVRIGRTLYEIKSMVCKGTPLPEYEQNVADAQSGYQRVGGYLFTRVEDNGEKALDLSSCRRVYITGTCSIATFKQHAKEHPGGDPSGKTVLDAPCHSIEIRYLDPVTSLREVA